MLDRELVIKELNRVGSGVFKQVHSIAWLNRIWWQTVTQSQAFLDAVCRARSVHMLALWHGELALLIDCQKKIDQYAVFAADGSQIYPDNHMEGIDCFLINTGGCFLSYGPSVARLVSEPTVYVPSLHFWPSERFSIDLVDLVREEHEFAFMATHLEPHVFGLFDGNLLFWYLASKPVDVKKHFAHRYIVHLQTLHQKRYVTAGYLSASRFTDVVNLVMYGIGLMHPDIPHKQHEQLLALLPQMSDGELLAHVLMPGQRTTMFVSMDDITEFYPDELKPCFFYLHVGSEVVRIELPAWTAAMPDVVNMLCAVCIDQCEKGQGYPVALAEAHARAVVQSGDREFFFQMLFKRGVESQTHVRLSPKSFKKRVLGF